MTSLSASMVWKTIKQKKGQTVQINQITVYNPSYQISVGIFFNFDKPYIYVHFKHILSIHLNAFVKKGPVVLNCPKAKYLFQTLFLHWTCNAIIKIQDCLKHFE